MADHNDNSKIPSIVDGELHNLENISPGEFARWLRQTTPGADVRLESEMSDEDDVMIVDANDGYFGVCPACGKHDGYENVGPCHWFVCHEHKARWFFGANLFDSWKDQTAGERQAAVELLRGYKEIEPLTTGVWPKNPLARAELQAAQKCEERRLAEQALAGPAPW